jgi:hypothetical protein
MLGVFCASSYFEFGSFCYRLCSGQKMPDSSYGRLSEALGNLGSGNLEGGGWG